MVENKDKIVTDSEKREKELMTYEECKGEMFDIMWYVFKGLDRHPTKFLVEVLEQFYGHKVDLGKFIDLIETSPHRR